MADYSIYSGTDPVLKRLHENLNKILWICKNKKPFPKDKTFEEVKGKNSFEDLLRSMGMNY